MVVVQWTRPTVISFLKFAYAAGLFAESATAHYLISYCAALWRRLWRSYLRRTSHYLLTIVEKGSASLVVKRTKDDPSAVIDTS